MTETVINTALFPDPPAMLTVRIGDHVKHWSGLTGVVSGIDRQFSHINEFADGEHVVYRTVILVQEDKGPRQRKTYPPVRWDGITEVMSGSVA